ncbi:hypothetical protein NW739_04605 [Mycoplasmopsis felis]|uniref:hypothetical protein n=1 Tax=Mycoplasmopsis felis TaxID=33923 RepID=UPI0021DF7842|nr:hypothetical protein [Mycoplasmopsis felis]MCU9939979.1 hypothetical protein [Mycoplasmopsis felis]
MKLKVLLDILRKMKGIFMKLLLIEMLKMGECEYHINQYIKSPVFKRFSLFSWGVIKERINDYYKLKK